MEIYIHKLYIKCQDDGTKLPIPCISVHSARKRKYLYILIYTRIIFLTFERV